MTWNPANPFPQSPRWLWIGVVTVWVVALFVGSACSTSQTHHETLRLLAVVTVCIALWANHWRHRAASGWNALSKIVLTTAVDLLKVLVLSAGFWWVATVAALSFSFPGCYSERGELAEMLGEASGVQKDVAQRAHAQGGLAGVGKGLTVPFSDTGRSGTVTADGVIVLVSEKPSAVFTLVPSWSEGEVTWTCHGGPRRLVPGVCRAFDSWTPK